MRKVGRFGVATVALVAAVAMAAVGACGDDGGGSGGSGDGTESDTDATSTGVMTTMSADSTDGGSTAMGDSGSGSDGGTTTDATGSTGPGTTDGGTTEGSTSTGGLGRVEEGLLVLYLFDEGDGDTVADQSGVEPALDLTIQPGAAVTWGATGLTIDDGSLLLAEDSPDKVVDGCQATNGITVEAWVTTGSDMQEGPARIAALSGGTQQHNFLLGQGSFGDPSPNFTFRLRTTDTGGMGTPDTVAMDEATTEIHHVVATHADDGTELIYVDGVEVSSVERTGTFDNWDDMHSIVVANEVSGDRPWLGELHLVAVYDRPLDAAEVVQNFDAGT